MQSLVFLCALFFAASTAYVPYQNSASSVNSNGTDSSYLTASAEHHHPPYPSKGHNVTLETIVTEIVYTTITTCPAGQTVTLNGETTVLSTPSVSIVYVTTTKTICPKCSETNVAPAYSTPATYGPSYQQPPPPGPGSSPGTSYGGYSSGNGQSSGSNNGEYGSSENSSPCGSGHGPSLHDILGNGNCYPPGMNPSGSYLPGKNPYGGSSKTCTTCNGVTTVTSTSKVSAIKTVTKTSNKSSHHGSSSTSGSESASKTSTTSASSSSSTASSKSGSSISSSSGSKSTSNTVTSSTSSSSSFTSSSTITTSPSSFSTTTSVSSTTITSSASLSSSTTSSSSTISSSSSSASALPSCYYWLENIQHQGISAFNPDSGYEVFRNVKDFGAVGDGVTDDTAAINAAISSGGRCAPGSCASSTLTPAIVYFPAGTYLVSSPIIDYYYTQIIGNPNCMPTIKASAGFSGAWVIDGDQYQAGGVLGFGSTNVFWRQIRNLVIDITAVPISNPLVCIHWPTAQATSLQNIVFQMSSDEGTQHEGVFIESGSGGLMTDLVFYGGNIGAFWGNQQFTTRNLTFYNAVTAISQLWDWGWTYKGITVENCTVALNISSLNNGAQAVGSVILIDSVISNTEIGIATVRGPSSTPSTGASMILENVVLNNVGTAIQGPNGALLNGGSFTIAGWGQGNTYTPNGPQTVQGTIPADNRPPSLLSGANYYEQSKPQYQSYSTSSFVSVRTANATGDGTTDDTVALQAIILAAAASGSIVFFDAGTYVVTDTLYIPSGSRIVGESYAAIMSSGSTFSDMSNPVPVIQVGKPGETGSIEWSDMLVSTHGAQAGAILIEWNLDASSSTPAGMWDVHTRIGGFAGSDLQLAECPVTSSTIATASNINENCIAAFMSMHVTPSASNLYMENNWLWTADHDVEDPNLTQITVYTGRGLYVESTAGTIWLYSTAVEHHALYQYQFANTQNVYMGQIQTETPYYQPNPPATLPFPPVASLNDPIFTVSNNPSINTADAWGLRIISSDNTLVYGAGLYSFFDNNNVTCSNVGEGEACQNRIFSVEGSSDVNVYNLNTVGTTEMITLDGNDVAYWGDNVNGFIDTVALFRNS